MTEQQACTLCGADGHRAYACPMRVEEYPPVLVPWSVLDRAVMWVEDRRRYGDDGTIADDWLALKAIQRAALAQPSPAPELERPEVVAYLNEWRHNDSGGIRVTPALSAMSEEGLQNECGPQASVVRREPLMTVSQHDRIGLQWASLVHRAQAKADAAQSRLAELEKQEPLAWVDADWIAQVSDPRGAGCTVRRAYGSAGADLAPLYRNPVAQAGQVPDAFNLLQALITGTTGRWILSKLDDGQGTELEDGKNWLAAREIVRAAPAQGGE